VAGSAGQRALRQGVFKGPRPGARTKEKCGKNYRKTPAIRNRHVPSLPQRNKK